MISCLATLSANFAPALALALPAADFRSLSSELGGPASACFETVMTTARANYKAPHVARQLPITGQPPAVRGWIPGRIRHHRPGPLCGALLEGLFALVSAWQAPAILCPGQPHQRMAHSARIHFICFSMDSFPSEAEPCLVLQAVVVP
jgi:hypothetical protein